MTGTEKTVQLTCVFSLLRSVSFFLLFHSSSHREMESAVAVPASAPGVSGGNVTSQQPPPPAVQVRPLLQP